MTLITIRLIKALSPDIRIYISVSQTHFNFLIISHLILKERSGAGLETLQTDTTTLATKQMRIDAAESMTTALIS